VESGVEFDIIENQDGEDWVTYLSINHSFPSGESGREEDAEVKTSTKHETLL
jgi:hypothetical protein